MESNVQSNFTFHTAPPTPRFINRVSKRNQPHSQNAMKNDHMEPQTCHRPISKVHSFNIPRFPHSHTSFLAQSKAIIIINIPLVFIITQVPRSRYASMATSRRLYSQIISTISDSRSYLQHQCDQMGGRTEENGAGFADQVFG